MRILVYRLSLNSECEDTIYFNSPTMQVIVPKKNHLQIIIILTVVRNETNDH